MVQFRLPMLPAPDEVPWSALVNGNEVSVRIESNAILLDVLRDKAGSLGTKRGCDMGTCGCCSVLIDGVPRLSCLTLAQEASGCGITTIEGLAAGHHLPPIQTKFTQPNRVKLPSAGLKILEKPDASRVFRPPYIFWYRYFRVGANFVS